MNSDTKEATRQFALSLTEELAVVIASYFGLHPEIVADEENCIYAIDKLIREKIKISMDYYTQEFVVM